MLARSQMEKPPQQISGEFNMARDVRALTTGELLALVAADGVTERD
jgi:hypothetical protein